MKHDHKRKRFRTYLRKHTHWRNQSEFFVACLFEVGAPPHPITQTYITSRGRLTPGSWDGMADWRDKVAHWMSAQLHHWINPTDITERYLVWLLQEQENNRISGL